MEEGGNVNILGAPQLQSISCFDKNDIFEQKASGCIMQTKKCPRKLVQIRKEIAFCLKCGEALGYLQLSLFDAKIV